MTLLYYDPVFLRHRTGNHPERPERLAAILERLEADGLAPRCERPAFPGPDGADPLTLHEAGYLEALEGLAARGGGWADPDTAVSPESPRAARAAVGAACDAVRRVGRGEAANAFCLVRPPGHHALADRAMGFCLLANAALAARVALDELGASRVLVVDFDVHHGNGTQDLFYRDGRVGFFSMHRYPFWPGSGAADETGAGPGLGATHNVPVRFGAPRERIVQEFRAQLGAFADRMRPELVVVSAGFDAHRDDPIGSLGLLGEDFDALTHAVLDVAAAHAGGRLVSVLEGGYDLAALAEGAALHLTALLSRDGGSAGAEPGYSSP